MSILKQQYKCFPQLQNMHIHINIYAHTHTHTHMVCQFLNKQEHIRFLKLESYGISYTNNHFVQRG